MTEPRWGMLIYHLRNDLVRLEKIAYRLPNPADLGVTLSPESELMYDRLRQNLFLDTHLMDDLLEQCMAEGVRRPERREVARPAKPSASSGVRTPVC